MIKNILFDFGGVLFNLNFNKTFDAFHKLGFGNFEEMYSQFTANPLFEELETGKISDHTFYETLQAAAPGPVSHTQIKDAWNAMLLGFRKTSLDYLHILKKDYNLFLLSNTNAIHYDFFTGLLKWETGYDNLDDFFTKAYYSHLIGFRKPDVEAFEYILNDAGITAGETLFIDDTYTNFPNAKLLGITTHHLLDGQLIEDVPYTSF